MPSEGESPEMYGNGWPGREGRQQREDLALEPLGELVELLRTRSRISVSVCWGVCASGEVTGTPASTCSSSPATLNMKNSSRVPREEGAQPRPLEQREGGIRCERQDPLIPGEPGKLAVEQELLANNW
jgi:hypothetical protein